ncbi:ATP-binding cassette sub-family B member 9-like protein [Labeo rohita]|uniref:ATP-binding cassette sub-family B member 9-like protein n=1 Tax=Labeo rohita TaxID=84645 RepID=A0A498MLB6_LABRO|nr:ATP-binding cassette sub-family B member 9-like protein [Labeo rohita]
MRVAVIISCNLVFTLVDVVVTTVLYIHGSSLDIFSDELEDFDIHRSTVDLWGTVLIRACLLFGASIGVFYNRSDGPQRVSNLGTLVSLICLTNMTYALAKLLMLSEEEALMYDPWFLSLFSWTCASAIVIMILWKLLSQTPNSVSEREDSEETERLVDGIETEEEFSKRSRKSSKEQPHSGATIGRLLSYCKKDSGLLAIAFFFLLLSSVCEAFIPYYTGRAIDGIVIQKSMDHFTKPMITLSVLALVSSIATGFRGGVFSVTFARLNIRLRNLLFRSLMRQEIGFFDANHTGDITSRLTSDTTQVSDLISQNVNLFLRSFVKAVGIFIFMFGMSWKLSVVTIMGFPYIAVVSKLYGEYYKASYPYANTYANMLLGKTNQWQMKLTKEVQTALAQANKVAEETISAMRTVRSFANEHQEGDSYYSKLQEMFVLNKKQAVAYACFVWSSYISELALQVAILYYGGHLVVTNQMTGGTLISFIIYELELGEALESISSVYTGLMQGVGAAEKVFEYIDRKPKHNLDGQEAPETFEGQVEFKNVTFAYPTWPEMDILKHGQVLVDGRPVNTYQHKYYHSKVALVSQEPVLFARTVQMNISYGVSEAPMEAVIRAAINANAHDFITGLSKGYESGVGEKGTQLSGGQKQRVAIARALIRNPRILILDEATSALDSESEYIVQQALNNLMREHTVLVIAHRLSTVERADNILVIDKGCVVEQGPHAELMARGGLYCKLVQRQILGIEIDADVPNPSPAPPWELKEGDKESAEDSSDNEREARY